MSKPTDEESVAAQVNHLLSLEDAYRGVCEEREAIPFKWFAQPNRDALQERANDLSGEIMRTERRIIEGLKTGYIDQLRATLATRDAEIARLRDAGDFLWVVLANVSGGNWNEQSLDWQDAVVKARDDWFAALNPHV